MRNSSQAHFSDVFMDTHSGEHAVLLGVPICSMLSGSPRMLATVNSASSS